MILQGMMALMENKSWGDEVEEDTEEGEINSGGHNLEDDVN